MALRWFLFNNTDDEPIGVVFWFIQKFTRGKKSISSQSKKIKDVSKEISITSWSKQIIRDFMCPSSSRWNRKCYSLLDLNLYFLTYWYFKNIRGGSKIMFCFLLYHTPHIVYCIGPRWTPLSVKLNTSTFIIKNYLLWYCSYWAAVDNIFHHRRFDNFFCLKQEKTREKNKGKTREKQGKTRENKWKKFHLFAKQGKLISLVLKTREINFLCSPNKGN